MFAIADCIMQLFLTGFAKNHVAVFTLNFSDLSASIALLLFFVYMIKNDPVQYLIFCT